MTLSAVGNRYAHALADVVTGPPSAPGAARPDVTVAELRSFDATLRGSGELRNALTSPAVPPARKRAVVARLAGVLELGPITRNLLFVLIDRRRISILGDVIDDFERIVDERLGFAQAEVTSARELTDAQRAALSTQLERLTGKKIRMRFAIDDALIGGAVARIGSTVYDGSVRGQLETLGRRLKAEA